MTPTTRQAAARQTNISSECSFCKDTNMNCKAVATYFSGGICKNCIDTVFLRMRAYKVSGVPQLSNRDNRDNGEPSAEMKAVLASDAIVQEVLDEMRY